MMRRPAFVCRGGAAVEAGAGAGRGAAAGVVRTGSGRGVRARGEDARAAGREVRREGVALPGRHGARCGARAWAARRGRSMNAGPDSDCLP
jgi:hypothetical protein